MFDPVKFAASLFEPGYFNFNEKALELFRYQATANPVYRQYLQLLNIEADDVQNINDIPFLPIDFFKTHTVISGNRPAEKVFRSSSTTGLGLSEHHVCSTELYIKSFTESFRLFWGDPGHYHIMALLPSYSERPDSSLIFMVQELMRQSGSPLQFHTPTRDFMDTLIRLNQNFGKPILLFAVSFALLDLAEQLNDFLPNTIIIETGGMKGRRKEIIREELHGILQEALHPKQISSEYGMTELLSQAYLLRDSHFSCPPWMRIFLRENNDPFSRIRDGKSGCMNVADLANVYSCAFIATSDLGRKQGEYFEVLGRMDNSDIRGCNLMY